MIKENVGRSVRVKIGREVLDGVITDQCYNAGKYTYTIAVNLENGTRVILRDVPGEKVEILPNLRDLAEAYLREVDQEEISRLCNAAADRENELDATFKRRLDEMLPGFAERQKAPAPASEDDVEIIIDPTPEQVPGGWLWCARWDEGTDMLEENLCAKSAVGIARWAWRHYAILVRGNIAPSEFCARVRKMLAEKAAEK